jgi:hypothetical protein
MMLPGKPWESKRDIRRAASCGLAFGIPASREPQSHFDSQGLLISFFESCPLKGGSFHSKAPAVYLWFILVNFMDEAHSCMIEFPP